MKAIGYGAVSCGFKGLCTGSPGTGSLYSEGEAFRLLLISLFDEYEESNGWHEHIP